MKTRIARSLALLAAFALTAVGCYDGSSPTGTALDEAPILTGSTAAGIFDPSPLFRAIGPSFEVTSLTSVPNGLLTVAADKGGKGKLHAVRRAQTLRRDISKTRTINPARGGTIPIGKAGMTVVIPAGALPGTDPVDVTVLAYKGKYHVYEFLPHGIQFNTPIHVTFDITNIKEFAHELEHRLKDLEKQQEQLAKCDERAAQGKKLQNKCRKLYEEWDSFDEDLTWYQDVVDHEGFVGIYFDGDVHKGGSLRALELFDISATDDQLTFQTDHFSGYALGM